MGEEISAEVRQFIEQNIDSIAQLETLLLFRQEPERRWSAEEIAKALYVPVEMASALLANFAQRGLLQIAPTPEAKYSCRGLDPKVDLLLGQVVDAYQSRRVAVTSLIYSRPLHKVQTFADAFRLRKENPQ